MEQSNESERRCPACGAVATRSAEWCWRCYERLPAPEVEPQLQPQPESEPEPEAEPAAAEPPGRPDLQERPASAEMPEPAPAPTKAATWPCAACGHRNAIELEACELCGTSFAAMMKADEKPPDVAPQAALKRSLIYPGLGHAMVGKSLDGIARGALFAMLLMMLAVVLLSGPSGGLGYAVSALFLLMCLVVYLETALEAYRLASGDPPLITSRTLLWVATGVILGSSTILAFTLIKVAKR